MVSALILALSLAAGTITGTVKDTSGAVVQGASIIIQGSGAEQQAVSGPDGRFEVAAPDGASTLVVRAGGFAEVRKPIAGSTELEIVLEPATLLETVTVTPTRTEQALGNIPVSVSVLTSEDIRLSPAVVADDVFRQNPTFSLFRRTSSLSSHPTSQGVSLRGIGPSGVSRTLVLMDGVPFNDPFGGWVYWTRVPLVSVERVEVIEDANSSLYGNYAMGGVINIVTGPPARRTVQAQTQYGNHNTPKADFLASDRWQRLGVAVEGSFFNTDGFAGVAAPERGPIDINADIKYKNLNAKGDYAATDHVSISVRGGYFSEDRTNAKIGEFNDTRWKFVNGGVRAQLPDGSDLQARVFADFQNFHSTFLAVTNATAARNLVRLSVDQHVPTDSVGGLVQWSRTAGHVNMLTAGADWRWVDGASHEDSYNAATPQTVIANPAPWGGLTPVTIKSVLALQRVSGGTQQITGGFVQDILTPTSKLTLTASARIDRWRNYSGHNLETAVLAGVAANNQPSFPDRTDTAVSPRLGALYHFTDWVSAWGAVTSGFRAPTLNELYRQFRQGTTLVLANNQLGAERLVGGEAGLNVEPVRNVTVKTTWFDNRVKNPVSNVTICAGTLNGSTCTPSAATTTQQRLNLGTTRSRGVQTEVDYRLHATWRASAAYVYDIAKVTDGGVLNAALATNCPGAPGQSCFLPEVPKHRATFQIAYTEPRVITAAFAVQYVGRQFDDDQNLRGVPNATLTAAGYPASTAAGLPGYATADLTVSRAIGRAIDVFFGVENMFDKKYFVGTLPTTIGSPRLVNGGVRVRFAAR